MKTSFEHYLRKQGQSPKSTASCEAAVRLFTEWMKEQSIDPVQGSYADVLAYMKHCQKKGTAQRTVQNYVNMVRHFYDHLIEQGQIESNPAAGIKVKGVKRKTLYHIFPPGELHAIYNSLETRGATDIRDKAMLGLMVYQGVKTEELGKLEVKDVKLKEGKIEVPGGRKSEARTLPLEAHQILEMHNYVAQVRQEILGHRETENLFIGPGGSRRPGAFVQYLLIKLRKKHPGIGNAKQLRASVIVKWLRMYNLRKVQYLAGHRYISSTESYRQSEMEGLTEEVNKFHPLG